MYSQYRASVIWNVSLLVFLDANEEVKYNKFMFVFGAINVTFGKSFLQIYTSYILT